MRLHRIAILIASFALICTGIYWNRSAAIQRARLSRELWKAVESGDAARASMLLDSGADPNVREVDPTASAGVIARIRDLFRGSAQAGAGRTALMRATDRLDPAVASILLKHGADPNIYDSAYGSALGIALGHGNNAAAHLLLHAGAEASQVQPDGFRPLTLALQWCHAATIAELLSHGAKLDVEDSRDVSLAVENPDSGVLAIFLDHGLSPNLTIDGSPLLMRAARARNVPAVKLLLERGADVNQRDPSGQTILERALEASYAGGSDWEEDESAAVVRFLKAHGAK